MALSWPSVVDHLWQSTLFAAAVWLATLGLHANRARVRYWLWVAASLKCVVPLSVLVSLGDALQWSTPPADMQPAVSFVMDGVLTPVVATMAAQASSARPFSILPWVILTVWIAGAASVLVSWWRHWRPIRLARRRAIPLQLGAHYDAADLIVMSST